MKVHLYEKLGAPDPFDPQATFTTSPFLSPLALAVVRLTLAFYTLFTLIFVLVWDSVRLHDGNAFFSYFTELSYIGLCAYFFAAGVQTLVYALSQGRSYPLERWPRIFQVLHALLFSTITTFPIIVTVVYWAALHPDSPFTDKFSVWSNVSMHALNTVFAFFEILFTDAGPTPWTHIPFIIIILACYLAVAYITHATQGFYTYSFLNPQKEGSALAGWIIGIAAAGVVVFAITRSLCALRLRYTRKSTSNVKNTVNVPPEALDEWETVELEQRSQAARRTRNVKHSAEWGVNEPETSFENTEESEKAGRRRQGEFV